MLPSMHPSRQTAPVSSHGKGSNQRMLVTATSDPASDLLCSWPAGQSKASSLGQMESMGGIPLTTTLGCSFLQYGRTCWLSDAGEVLPSFVLSQCSDALRVLRCILVHGARHCPLSMDHQPADCYGRPAGVRYT